MILIERAIPVFIFGFVLIMIGIFEYIIGYAISYKEFPLPSIVSKKNDKNNFLVSIIIQIFIGVVLVTTAILVS